MIVGNRANKRAFQRSINQWREASTAQLAIPSMFRPASSRHPRRRPASLSSRDSCAAAIAARENNRAFSVAFERLDRP
jgi:hypothetical protein